MRAAALLSLVMLAGCGVELVDPCSGVNGTCLAIQVESSSSVQAVDSLAVHLGGGGLDVDKAVHQGQLDLPIAVGVILDSLPQSPADLQILVEGSLGGVPSQGSTSVTIASGEHRTVHVQLEAALNDLSVGDAADLAGADLSGLDLSIPDMAGVDQAGEDLPPIPPDPTTCAEAAASGSYIGCDFWATQTFNGVWSIFDFAVVVSNPGAASATVTISGGVLGANKMVTAPPGQLIEVGLPWVPALKGTDDASSGAVTYPTNSVLAPKGAYHITSTLPIIVYQFNALEYKGGASGNDLNGTAWSTCPGSSSGAGCFSFSNDASLLLPTTALSGSYYVTGIAGVDYQPPTGPVQHEAGPFVAITGTTDNTTVTVKLGAQAQVVGAGGGGGDAGVTDRAGGGTLTFRLDTGDVAELLAAANGTNADFAGSRIEADHAVQVITGHPCTSNPQVIGSSANYSCDHVEEMQPPYQTWGKQYVVTSPTGPNGDTPSYTVRIYGGANAATLSYSPSVSPAPSSIAAGAVAQFDATTSFYVSGDHEFAVSTLQKSGSIVDPSGGNMQKGDPSLSFITPVEQWRGRYLFLAPNDYDVTYADVTVRSGTNLVLDNVPVAQSPTTIGAGYGVVRLLVGIGATGAHQLSADQPFGAQIMGYGAYTSYQYPAGQSLQYISPTPPP